MPTAIFEAVLGNLAVGAALAVVALAVGRWATRPALAHALWLLVLVKLITPPLFVIPIHCLPAVEEPAIPAPSAPTPGAQQAFAPAVATEFPAASATAPAVPPVVAAAASTVEQSLPAAFPPALRERTGGFVPSWQDVLLGVWMVGAAAAIAVALRRARRFTRLLSFAAAAPGALVEEVAATAGRMGLRRVPRVRVMPGGIAPLLWAVGRPTLYFPAGLLERLTADQRRALIGHELAHLRRRDHVVRLIEFVTVAVYWWCPLAWVARRELRRLEEEACDAEVIASTPGSGYAYASAILETIDYLSGVAPAPALASGIGDAHSLRKRLEFILGAARPARISFRTRLVLIAVAPGLLAVGPEFDRLSAAVAEAVPVEMREHADRGPFRPVLFDEQAGEPVQFLPTPLQILKLDRSAPSLASALSPDGSRLAIAAGSNAVVWDRAANRALFTITHAGTVNAVAFSPDGTRIATASDDTTAAIWDAADGRRLHTLAGHGRWVLAVAFSPDGKMLATGGYDRAVRIWNAATGEPAAVWTGHSGGVRAVAYSPDGRTLASGGADSEVRLWDVARGVTTHILKKHTAAVRVVAFSPDGSRLATGAEDRTIVVWNPANGREVGSPVSVPDFVTALGFSPRGQGLYAGTFGGHILHVDPVAGEARGYVGVEPGVPAARPAHSAAVNAILTPPQGAGLLTISQDGAVFGWRSAGPPQKPRLAFRSGLAVTAVALSPDGKTLATGGPDGVIHLWDAATARELMRLPGHPRGVSALMFGVGRRLVSAGADERVRVWDTTSGRALHTIIQPTADLCIALSPDGLTVAIGGRKLSGLTILNLAAPSQTRRIAVWAGEVSAVAFNPAGDRIATGYEDGMFRMWRSATGEELVRGRAGTGSVDWIAFNPEGSIAALVVNAAARVDDAASSGPRHAVMFLSARDGAVLENPRELSHPGPVTAAAFAADGNVLTAARDGNLYLWDAARARVVRTIRGHVDAVRGVAVAPDGTAVFSAGGRAAKMWPMKK